ncbi:hypothetical protein [Agrobacterium fabrum]|nr:hypothetical protein [Agrobacterium fabrum]MCR6726196.1 hypothetical protein [Agrobacterium fabrum]
MELSRGIRECLLSGYGEDMPDTPRFFRYAVLAAMFPIAVLGLVGTPNEYRAIGIDAVDCDGPVSVLIAAAPAFVAYAIIGWMFISGAKHHRSGVAAVFCGLVCLALAWNIGMALRENQRNAAETVCGSSSRL